MDARSGSHWVAWANTHARNSRRIVVPETVRAPEDALDIDQDGRRDVFEHCASSEGVRFRVRSAGPGTAATLWSGYYYLGYDVEADCPDTD